MRIVLDTHVSSLLLKRTLPPELLAQLAPHEVAITFLTVGELRKWAVVRQLGARRRAELDAWVDARPKMPAGADVARTWGEIVGSAARRGRPRPVNDSWIAACCLTTICPLPPSTAPTSTTTRLTKVSSSSPLTVNPDDLHGPRHADPTRIHPVQTGPRLLRRLGPARMNNFWNHAASSLRVCYE